MVLKSGYLIFEALGLWGQRPEGLRLWALRLWEVEAFLGVISRVWGLGFRASGFSLLEVCRVQG